MSNSNPVVTSSAGVGGTISPNGVFTLNYGNSQVFIVKSDKGYVINQVLVNGTSALENGIHPGTYSLTVQNVTGSTTISATFAPSGGPSSVMPSYQYELVFAVVLAASILLLFAVTTLKKRRQSMRANFP